MALHKIVEFEFDEQKNDENIGKHGISLASFSGFDSEPLVLVDDRRDYGETRYRALGRIDDEGHCLVFTLRGSTMRLISLRRAHAKEMKRYGR